MSKSLSREEISVVGYFTAQTGEGGRGREGVGGGEGNCAHNFKMHNVIATLFLSRFHSDPGVPGVWEPGSE